MSTPRLCREEEIDSILAIINAAAEAYRGVIPPDRWHEPYMSRTELQREIDSGVEFWGLDMQEQLIGVMGIQPVRDVDLIRHAYVRPDRQRHGVGATLIEHLRRRSARSMLVGTWAAANWAIAFYQRHGFHLVSPAQKAALLQTYWTIPPRQIEVSVVLASPAREP
jgi:GNAT superfamily N-acetyltransferase